MYTPGNWLATEAHPADFSGFVDSLKNYVEGYKLAGEPARMNRGDERDKIDTRLYEPSQQAKLRQMLLGNDASAAKLPYVGPQAAADVQLAQAQAHKAMHPELSDRLTGPAAEANGIQMLIEKYGKDSPVVKNAMDLFRSNLSNRQSMQDYRSTLMNTQEKRIATTPTKQVLEIEDIKQGFVPGTGRQQRFDSPEQQNDTLNQYRLNQYNKNTDRQFRQKNAFAHNMDITIGRIKPNMDALVQYGGPMGAAKLIKDITSDETGNTSKDYENYKKAMTDVMVLGEQVRQFYGTSITPQTVEKLEWLANPTSWKVSPQTAKKQMQEFFDLLASEAKTYQEAGKSPDVLLGNQGSQSKKELTYNLAAGRFE